MSTGESRATEPGASTPGLETSWRSLEVGGIVVAVLGLLALLFPLVATISVAVLFGGLLVVGGLVHVAHAFRAREWRGFLLEALLGVVYAFGGIALLSNPVIGVVTLTVLLVAYLLVSGLVEIAMGAAFRGEEGWAWVIASGAFSIVLAGLLWVGFFTVVPWALGVIVGVHLLSTGLSMIVVARGVRQRVGGRDAESMANPELGKG